MQRTSGVLAGWGERDWRSGEDRRGWGGRETKGEVRRSGEEVEERGERLSFPDEVGWGTGRA